MSTKRPWKVCPGYTYGFNGTGLTFELPGNGIPMRSYATEETARAAAIAMVTPDRDNCLFAAAFHVVPRQSRDDHTSEGWSPGIVNEYRSTDDGYILTTHDLLAELKAAAS